MDEVLRRAIEPVLRDLQGAGIAAPRIDDDDWAGHPDWLSVMLWSPDGSAIGASVKRSGAVFEQVALVADQVQEWAIEELWRQGSTTNWPPCPQHPNHPMKATARDFAAVWVCPVDETLMATIGRL